MKTTFKRAVSIILIVLFSVALLAACDEDDPRVVPITTYSPGPAFSTNFRVVDSNGNPDARRQIKCSIVFEVIDEEAAVELEAVNYRIRNAVLLVLSELTLDEVILNRDNAAICARITDRVNAEVQATVGGRSEDIINLVIRAYFTEFQVI